MNFTEACKEMKKGYKIRINSWPKSMYLKVNTRKITFIVVDESGDPALDIHSLLSEDWVVIPESRTSKRDICTKCGFGLC